MHSGPTGKIPNHSFERGYPVADATIRSLLVSASADVSDAKTKLDALTSILQPVPAAIAAAIKPEDLAAVNTKLDAVAAKIDALAASIVAGGQTLSPTSGPTVDDVKAIVAAATGLVVAKLDAIATDIGVAPAPAVSPVF